MKRLLQSLLRLKLAFPLGLVICCAAVGFGEEPVKVSPCQLKDDRAPYNHKLIEVTGFVSHGFEDFTIFDPGCGPWLGVWLEYGGTAASGTIYCCNVPDARSRPQPLVVEDIPVSLVDDVLFRRFDKLLQRKPDSIVHATIVGRFFAGRQVKYETGVFWGGYGHMGCCSLLAIQQVVAVDSQDRDDLDYGATTDQVGRQNPGCGYSDLMGLPTAAILEAQRKYDGGGREWSFSQPQRVASEALAQILKTDEGSITGLGQMRKAQGRFVYEWRPKSEKAKDVSYMIVVSRPYWLSFYAKDPQRVAWVAVAAYKSWCDRK